MAIAVAGTVSVFESASGSGVLLSVPTGAAVGEVLVAQVTHSSTAALVAPSGWTLIRSASTADAETTALLYRVVTGSETSTYTFATSATAGRIAGFMARFSGVDTTTPLDAAAVGATTTATGTSVVVPSITTVTAGAMLVAGVAINASASADINTPAGMTKIGALPAGTGRRSALFTETIASAGATGTRTFTQTSTSLQWAANMVALRPGSVTPPTPTLSRRMVGIPSGTSAPISVRTGNAASVRLKIGTNSAVTTGVIFSSAGTPNAQGDTIFTVTGLTAGTQYFYRVAMTPSGGSESLDTASTVGSFRTAPSGATSFAFCFGSCTNSTDSAAMTAIAARGDDLFFHLGDLFYDDASGTTVANLRSHFDAKLEAANHQAVLATTPSVYIPSDHDGMNNNSNAGSDATAWTNWNSVFREKIPAPNVPATTGVYYTFVWGRVRFIVTDTRSFASIPSATDNSSKTRLGATQKQWVKDTITAATEPVIVLVQADPWIGTAVAGDDAWLGYTTERTEMASFYSGTGKKIVLLHGDQHAVAADSGVNSPGGLPVFAAAPFNNNASQKGGPYSAGVYPASGTAVVQQYGRVVVTDSGSAVSLAFTGYSSDNTVRVTQTTSVSLVPPSTGTAAGSWSFAGAATGKRTPKGTAAGSWSFTGAATGKRSPKSTAAGSWSFTGAATGKRTPKGTAAGSWSFTGAATGKRSPKSTAAGSWGFTGAAVGVSPVPGVSKGTASGVWGFTGAAIGKRTPKGTASGTWGFIGFATTVLEGQPTSAFVWDGSMWVPETVFVRSGNPWDGGAWAVSEEIVAY